MRIVVALGGNALLRRGQALTAENQATNIASAAQALGRISDGNELVVVHGSGPQVGLLALQDAAVPEQGNFPLDILNAETTGMIGYPVAQELGNVLPERRVASLLTQIEVDPEHPAFRNPTKPIGPVYDEDDARALAERRGWTVGRDGKGWRRIVPSPPPVRILEMDVIRLLVDAGVVLLCAGGGGIPVVFDAWGRAHGVEAIIDKDPSAALVARELEADALLLLWGTEKARPLGEVTVEEIRSYEFPAGSMGPKVAAAADFAARTGGLAAIGCLEEAPEILAGGAGTRIRRD